MNPVGRASRHGHLRDDTRGFWGRREWVLYPLGFTVLPVTGKGWPLGDAYENESPLQRW